MPAERAIDSPMDEHAKLCLVPPFHSSRSIFSVEVVGKPEWAAGVCWEKAEVNPAVEVKAPAAVLIKAR